MLKFCAGLGIVGGMFGFWNAPFTTCLTGLITRHHSVFPGKKYASDYKTVSLTILEHVIVGCCQWRSPIALRCKVNWFLWTWLHPRRSRRGVGSRCGLWFWKYASDSRLVLNHSCQRKNCCATTVECVPSLPRSLLWENDFGKGLSGGCKIGLNLKRQASLLPTLLSRSGGCLVVEGGSGCRDARLVPQPLRMRQFRDLKPLAVWCTSR